MIRIIRVMSATINEAGKECSQAATDKKKRRRQRKKFLGRKERLKRQLETVGRVKDEASRQVTLLTKRNAALRRYK